MFCLNFLIKLNRKQLCHLLSLNVDLFVSWEKSVHQVVSLNSKYPLAIPPISKGCLVCQADYRDYDKSPIIFSEDDIKLMPRKTINNILSFRIDQFELSQSLNSFFSDLDYTIWACCINAQQYRDAITSETYYSDEHRDKLRLNPFERYSAHFRPNVFEYAYRIFYNGHHCFYHFTDKSNLKSIVKNGGLYSWAALNELNIESKMGGDELSHRLDAGRCLQDYVRLGITPNHPMMYRLQECGYDLVVLCIHPIVAMLEGTLFSNMNATDRNCKIGGEINDFMLLSRRGTMAFVEKDDILFKLKQGEVLIPHFLPLKYITNIYDIIRTTVRDSK